MDGSVQRVWREASRSRSSERPEMPLLCPRGLSPPRDLPQRCPGLRDPSPSPHPNPRAREPRVALGCFGRAGAPHGHPSWSQTPVPPEQSSGPSAGAAGQCPLPTHPPPPCWELSPPPYPDSPSSPLCFGNKSQEALSSTHLSRSPPLRPGGGNVLKREDRKRRRERRGKNL